MADKAPIIIKKIKKSAAGHHGGSWKVAFADFMTAMMAFFLVMWILGLDQETRSAIAGYFNDPFNFMKKAEGNTLETVLQNPKGDSVDGKASAVEVKSKSEDIESLDEIKSEIEQTIQQDEQLQSVEKNVEIRATEEGLVIEAMEGAGSVFFESGSAELRPIAKKLFYKVGKLIASTKRKIVVDGHTDAAQFSAGSSYDNWDLSQDRAQATNDLLRSAGVKEEQILAIRGFASRKLKVKNNPTHFSNRRVTVLLPYKWKEEAVTGSAGEIGASPIQVTIAPILGIDSVRSDKSSKLKSK